MFHSLQADEIFYSNKQMQPCRLEIWRDYKVVRYVGQQKTKLKPRMVLNFYSLSSKKW